MVKSISKRNSLEASTANTLGKPLSGDETLGFDPDIRFYKIEDGDNTEEV